MAARLFSENEFLQSKDPIENLDVTLLQKNVLAPVFGIDDPRTSKKINFVGGIRGTAELEKLVDSGEYACAFSMFPTGMDDLMAMADAGEIMPPKSTWFEPKLRDGDVLPHDLRGATKYTKHTNTTGENSFVSFRVFRG